MKKIALSLAGVLAAVAFAPEASAVPVFARQTGMACSACHFQHFPLLNGFGRAFKAAGFTMMGAQGKVEGEHLDIPDRLNMGVLTSAYVQTEANAGAKNTRLGVPASGGELSIFYGGHISEFAGFLSELGLSGGAGTGAAKLAMLFPVGDSRIGGVAYFGGQGAAYGFELLNTGASDTHKMMGNGGSQKEHVAATYAASWLGTRTNATGVNLVAVNPDMGFVSFGQYADDAAGGGANSLPLTYVRAAGLFNLGAWEAGLGIQNFSGDMSKLGSLVVYKATVIDAQLQGEVAGMSTGLYVTYGTAPADVNGNKMAGGWSTLIRANQAAGTVNTGKATTFNVAGSLELIPHIATLQAAARLATLGKGNVAGAADVKDNAIMLGATYELAQNIELGLNYTMQSGSGWDAIKTATGKDGIGKKATTFLLEVLF